MQSAATATACSFSGVFLYKSDMTPAHGLYIHAVREGHTLGDSMRKE